MILAFHGRVIKLHARGYMDINPRFDSRIDVRISTKRRENTHMAIFGIGKDKPKAQKHSIIEVIKYDGPNDVLIWKFPNEDFNTNTQLIVGPSQEAIFVKGGQVLERFISGTYTLSTKNYPFIRALVNLATGGVSPFSCVVYYVNKVVSMGIEWGTDTPISVVDPVYGVPIDVRSYGDFSLQVENGQKLMEKLVGQTQGFSHQEVQQFFSNMMATQVRGVISGTMLERGLSPIGIDAHLSDMSAAATERIRPLFEPYGMVVNHFTIAAVTAPELDSIKQKSRDLQEHRMETEVGVEDKRKFAQAQAFENRELGVTEQQKMVGRAMETLAGNPGPMMGAAGGMGMGFPGIVGGNIVQPSAAGAERMAGMLLNQQTAQQPVQDYSGTMPGGGMPGMGMMEEAAPQPAAQSAQESFEQRAKKIKFLLDNGMISQEQYQEKLAQLMNEI